jgi:hypothetical protein
MTDTGMAETLSALSAFLRVASFPQGHARPVPLSTAPPDPPFTRPQKREPFRGLIGLTLVNSMHPGTTEADMGDQVLTMRARNLGANDPRTRSPASADAYPDRPHGAVTDIAKGIVFLARTLPVS